MPIPSIHEEFDGRCYALTKKGRRCLNRSRYAEDLRQRALGMDPHDPALVVVLHNLAVKVHCAQWHHMERFGFVPVAEQSFLAELQQQRSRTTPRPIAVHVELPNPPSSVRIPTTVERVPAQPVRQSTQQSTQQPVEQTIQQLLQRLLESVQQPPLQPPRQPAQQPQQQPPQQPRPVTRSYAAANSINPEVRAPNEPRYIPYGRPSTGKIYDAIARKVQKRISEHQPETERTKFGHIYLYTRPDAPEFIKIGRSNNVFARLGTVQRNCGFEPNLVHMSPTVNNVHRIEQLIFTQLRGLRHYNMSCIDRPSCQTMHEEWFKISMADATKVIDQWAAWAAKDPYDDNGRLKEDWVSYAQDWAEYCSDERLVNGLDLDFGCELPDRDASSAVPETHARNSEAHTHEDCSICYEHLEFGQQRLRSCRVCRNCWHDECIGTWLAESDSCPMCRGRNTLTVTNV